MYKKLLLILTAIFLVFAFSQCSKSPKGEKDKTIYNTTLRSLTFKVSDNSGLTENIYGVINGDAVYVTVPENVSLTNLIPSFTVQDGVEIYLNNNKIESPNTKFDFSNTVSLLIKSPADETKYKGYYILAKNGNSTIDKMVYDVMVKYNIPGISVSASKNEKLIYSSGYGFADKSSRERTTSKHLFRLASMSKSQTSLCIMKLYEAGKLTIDQKVFGEGGILEQEFGTNMPAKAKLVTVRNLLEHNSGWVSDPDPCFTSDSRFSGKSMDERIAYVVNNISQTYEPGTKYSYYNLGFGILGKIIEKLSGKEYEQFLKDEIWTPAGITDMHVGGGQAERRKNEVVYYSQDGTNGYGNDMQVIKALGGLIASTDELMELMSHIDYRTDVPDILKSSTLDLMYTPSKAYQYYGLGWRLNHSIFSDWASYHSGNLAGTATLWVRGKSGVNATILCNSRSYIDGFDTALYEIVEKAITVLQYK